jgi:hypothetical protein
LTKINAIGRKEISMKITITGDAYVATTSIKAEDIELLRKCKPEALRVIDKDENEKFALGYNEGHSCVGDNGITFGGRSRNGDGTATVTGSIPAGTEKVKEYIVEKFGAAIPYVNQLEKSIPDVVAEVKAQKAALLENIVVAG